jgi:hypothetical protein
MFTLNAHITIGPYSFTGVHEVRVRRSLNNYTETATIKIPTSARLRQAPGVSTTVQTAEAIQAKMPVTIRLGYDGDLRTEFEGFVGRVNFASPVEIECEGYFQPLKYTSYEQNFEDVKLEALLEYLLSKIPKDLGYFLSPDIPDAPLGRFYCDNRTGTEILDELAKDGFAVYFRGKTLFAGLQYTSVFDTVKYRLGWNVIKDNELKFRRQEDVRVRINAIYIKPDNTRISTSVGPARGAERTMYFTNISAKEDAAIRTELKARAENELQKISYDGYEGKITTFLKPFALQGDTAELEDPVYPERNGNYVIEATEVRFGMNGARRQLNLGIKITR